MEREETGRGPDHPPLRVYRGELTQPERWADYRHRPGDVFVCTPAKSGTTWTQAIVTMLLHGTPDLPGSISALSPWIDAGLPGDLAPLTGRDAVVAALEAQAGARCLKTHTPGDGIPVWDTARYITVYRHPVDVFLSLCEHLANSGASRPSPTAAVPLPKAFEDYVTRPYRAEACDEDRLESITHHYASFPPARFRHRLILHYADMRRDRAGAVARIASFIGVGLPARALALIVEATGFEAMRGDAARFAPFGGTGFWREDRAFFREARHGGGATVLGPAERAAYDARMAELTEPAVRRFLEGGQGV